jgi:integrase
MQSQITAPARVKRPKHPEGIEVRHKKHCPAHDGRRCSCQPTWRAVVVVTRANGKPVRRSKSFPSSDEAVRWRREAQVAIDNKKLHARSPITVREASRRFVEGAEAGAIRNRSGDIYKPSALRGIEEAFRLRLVPDLGARKLAEVQRVDLQRLVGRMQASGKSPSTIRNTINAARALYRWAVRDDLLQHDPTNNLDLPAVRGRRDRIASPLEADALLTALPEAERPLWTTALYAGLRRGELRALDWSDVDFDRGVIHVERSWDNKAGEVLPKSEAGRRDVPIAEALRLVLLRHKLAQGRGGLGLVFGRSATRPFNASTVQSRAQRAWAAAGLGRLTPHNCRHTYASLMIAAGTSAPTLQRFMGHASITMTIDRYRHLMPGAELEAAAKLDAYLTAARAAS